VNADRGLTDERLLADLETEVRPLVDVIRPAVADSVNAPGGEAARLILNAAPAAECVQLAGVWAGARAIGLDTDRVMARFGPEDQMLIELVAAAYAPPPPSSANLPSLDRLLDDSGLTPPPVARK
jgi:hypothetical protein